MKKFKKFLKDFFTTNISLKFLALGLAAVTVFLANIVDKV